MKNLSEKNAIITGGSRGIGCHIARHLAKEKVNLALVALKDELNDLNTITSEIKKLGVRAIAIPADITSEDDRKMILEYSEKELGPIDILVNNVGIGGVADFKRQGEDDIIKTINTNLTSPILLTKLLLPGMLKRKAGHIVSISSGAGKFGTPFQSAYSASKAGLIQWTAALRNELRGTGVDLSVVVPGYVAGAGMFADYRINASKEYKTPMIVGEVLPDDVAEAVIKIIKNNKQQIIVSPGPFRVILAINELFPGFAAKLMDTVGVKKLNQEMASDLQKTF
ncbi:MAG: ketoacyl reductase [Desulfobacterium sp.]|nr:ketoacyl reductase [Desulfobacterium sp.]